MQNNDSQYPNINDLVRARQFNPNQQQNNQGQFGSDQNHNNVGQYPNINDLARARQFNPNQQQNNQGQFGSNQNQNNFNNMNPNIINQEMSEEKKMEYEGMKQVAIQQGKILKQQKDMMIKLNEINKKNELYRKTCDMTLFFKNNNDIFSPLPINVKADQFLFELLHEYKVKSGYQNVRFFFHGKELIYNENSPIVLHEIEGLRTGEEIIVKST